MTAKLAHFSFQITVEIAVIVVIFGILVLLLIIVVSAPLRVSLGAQGVKRGHILEIFFYVYRGAVLTNFILFLLLFIYNRIFVVLTLARRSDGRTLDWRKSEEVVLVSEPCRFLTLCHGGPSWYY